MEWPLWARWPEKSRWDEYVPQAYRTSYAAFQATWNEQTQALRDTGAYRPQELVAGIRIVGEGAPSSWPQLRDSMLLPRQWQQAGHVLWFSRGVLDLYASELQQFYASSGAAPSPHFAPGWRRPSVALQLDSDAWRLPQASASTAALPTGRYRAIGHDGNHWRYLQDLVLPGPAQIPAAPGLQRVELLVDRRGDSRLRPPAGTGLRRP